MIATLPSESVNGPALDTSAATILELRAEIGVERLARATFGVLAFLLAVAGAVLAGDLAETRAERDAARADVEAAVMQAERALEAADYAEHQRDDALAFTTCVCGPRPKAPLRDGAFRFGGAR